MQSTGPISFAISDTLASWREMFDRRSFATNVAAGLTVAMVAIPLNLALAVACGLPPSAGLVSGAIAGFVGALFGGARLNITGPEVALAPLTATIVAAHGLDGLVIATALAGLMQIALGVSGIGGLVRLLPRPVTAGFLAAVGIMVFDKQIPHLLGVHDGRGVLEIAGGITDELRAHGTAVGVGLAVIVVLVALPKIAPRVPAPLVALALAVGLVAWLGLPVERVDPVHGSAIALHIPSFAQIDWLAILPSAIALAALASVDSLLCAVSVDARMGGPRHRPDQELVAQGVANIACAAVGGMPVAAAVVRSVAAIEARGSTRLCGVVQSLVLLAVVCLLGAHLDVVPLAALSGVLLVVGAKLIHVGELVQLAHVRRFDAVVLVVTSVAIIALGFVEGLAVGLGLAVLELAGSHASALRLVARREPSGTRVARVEGPLVFASQESASRLLEPLDAEPGALVVELDGVTQWDASGLAALRSALEPLAKRGAHAEVSAGRAIPEEALERTLAGIAKVRGVRPEARPSRAPTATLALEQSDAE